MVRCDLRPERATEGNWARADDAVQILEIERRLRARPPHLIDVLSAFLHDQAAGHWPAGDRPQIVHATTAIDVSAGRKKYSFPVTLPLMESELSPP